MGTILPYIGSVANIPAKWALCNGSNGTPNLNGRFLEGVTSASAAKTTKAAGLPNITGGYFDRGFDTQAAGTGCFQVKSGNLGGVPRTGHQGPCTDQLHYAYFNASLSSSVYGNSTTVQPNSYTVMYIMKIKA